MQAKGYAVRGRARRHLGDQQPVGGDPGEQAVVTRRIGHIDAAGEHRDRHASRRQGTEVRLRVYPEGAP